MVGFIILMVILMATSTVQCDIAASLSSLQGSLKVLAKSVKLNDAQRVIESGLVARTTEGFEKFKGKVGGVFGRINFISDTGPANKSGQK